jgi:hypothetical protein
MRNRAVRIRNGRASAASGAAIIMLVKHGESGEW